MATGKITIPSQCTSHSTSTTSSRHVGSLVSGTMLMRRRMTTISCILLLLLPSSSLAFPAIATTLSSTSVRNSRASTTLSFATSNIDSQCRLQSRNAIRSSTSPLPSSPMSMSKSRRNCLNMIKPGGDGGFLSDVIARRATSASAVAAAAATAATLVSMSYSLFFNQHQILASRSFYLTRIVFLRALGFVYGVAFLVAKHQNRALIGDNGITPVRHVLNSAYQRGLIKTQQRLQYLNSTYAGKPIIVDGNVLQQPIQHLRNTKLLRQLGMKLNQQQWFRNLREVLWDRTDGMGRPVTTLLWIPYNNRLRQKKNDLSLTTTTTSLQLNSWLDGIATCGLSLSSLLFLLGSANVPILLMLWICQRSLMSVGGPWYGFGWEPQLAELGFHAMFLVPLFNLNSIPIVGCSPPSILVIWMIRWYLFRIMMGAGLIKLRSNDIKWKFSGNLSTMDYFYETQPVPNPFTRYFHFMPHWWHQCEVLTNHFVELIAPWMFVIPLPWRSLRVVGGWIQIAFQGILISSGNLSFLNWLTAVPAILCLDDAVLGKLFFSTKTRESAILAAMYHKAQGTPILRQLVSISFVLLIGTLSIPVVKNLCSKRQLMNSSFDRLRLVNTYGAFGTVDEVREEYVISAATNYDGPWYEYEFKVKPGNIYRRPRFISPYHYRLDWLMWIASTVGRIDRSPWIYNFLYKLLEQDPDVLELLAENPFKDKPYGPKYIRIDRYRYKFARNGRGGPKEGVASANEQETRDEEDGAPSPQEVEVDSQQSQQPYWERELIDRVFPRNGIATKEMLKDYIYDTI